MLFAFVTTATFEDELPQLAVIVGAPTVGGLLDMLNLARMDPNEVLDFYPMTQAELGLGLN